MTRIFHEDGSATAVSVIKVEPNRVVNVKTEEKDGYSALQVTTGSKKRSRLSKPISGFYASAGVEAGRILREVRLTQGDTAPAVGEAIGLDLFTVGQYVDVKGISIGKGFQGVIKRHNFRMQDATHGNSRSHRAPGSIGQNQTPGRVMKGKKMAGHMGNEVVTVQSLKICAIDNERSLIMISGSVPGPKGSDVVIKPAIKRKGA